MLREIAAGTLIGATVRDAVDVIERLRACHREARDGGP
jgi:hypothetical protein